MTIYTVTTSNWNSPAFWSGVNVSAPGNTLDFTALPATYTIDFDADTNLLALSDGTTDFTVADSTYVLPPLTTPPDETIGGASQWDFFTILLLGDSDNSVRTGDNDMTVTSGLGDDTIYSGAGNDSIDAGAGNNFVQSGTGNDTLLAGAGNDSLRGNEGDDSIDAGDGNNLVEGENGSDFIRTGIGDDTVYTGWGFADIDTVYSGAGDDLIFDGAGSGIIYGEAGQDWIDAGNGDDLIDAGDDADLLVGALGDDTIDGAAGDDTMTGGAGNDSLIGGDGQDHIYGAAGDTVDGSEGGIDADTLYVSDVDSISYTTAEDGTVFFTTGGSLSFTNIETVITLSNDGIVQGTAAGEDIGQFFKDADGDWVDNNDANGAGGTTGEEDSIVAGGGDDRIWASRGNDIAFGDAGNDFVSGGGGQDTLYGGTGTDTIYGEGDEDEIYGGFGNDYILGGDANDTIYGQEDNDSLEGGNGDDFILGDDLTGPDGNDTIDGQDGADILYGFGGDDVLRGGLGGDSLNAGTGDDWLHGGDGADTLTGGAGNDRFSYSGGNGDDLITDFNFGNTGTLSDGDNSNNDFIDLSAFYDHISELYADQTDDGVLNQSNATDMQGRSTDYSNNAQFGAGSLTLSGASGDPTFFTAENTGVTCFTSGTFITTPTGDVPIDTLKVGDLVQTLDNGPQPLRWIVRSTFGPRALRRHPELRPVLIQEGVLGATRDLFVSQQHGVLPKQGAQIMLRAKHLALGNSGVRVARGKRQVTYIHLMFENHQIVFSNGVASESFYPGPMAIGALHQEALDEFRLIFPDFIPGQKNAKTKAMYGAKARRLVNKKVKAMA